jgi:hypothetical protein
MMQDQKLLVTVALLLAFGLLATLASMANGSSAVNAVSSTPTATPCQYPLVPNPDGPGCRKVTQTPTPSRTPCPTAKVPDTYHGFGCGTPTATPTSQRPYGASVRLVDHFPSPAISGAKKAWVFEIENIGSQYGCEAHEVTLSAQLTGQGDASLFQSALLGCHETAQVTVSSIVTVPLGQTITISAQAQAGAQSGNKVYASDDVVNPPPPTAPPRELGDFNCDNIVNSIDALLVLRISAGLAVPLPCTGDGDVNHDGRLNAIDAFLMVQYTAGLITSFA